MFGYDWTRDPAQTGQKLLGDEFRFDEVARESTRLSLLSNLPRRLTIGLPGAPTVNDFFSRTTNETPATMAIMCGAMSELSRYKEIEVYSKDGKLRSPGVKIAGTDRICIPSQKKLFVRGV
jgi:hypothetical protein